MNVFVGLSGGVDSAVSAARLQRDGHDVTGVFIKIWRPEFLECTWREDRLDAMRVAAHLAIPFCEIDLSEAYERAVVRDMVRTYEAGMTPNPDVACNQYIKFGAFAEWAFAEGAERIATGHYARIREREEHPRLLRARDAGKDQSYFLYRMHPDMLDRTLFPIGELPKEEVRALARRFGLPVSERPDSQGLCFVGDISLPTFLRRFIEVKRGAVLDSAGTVIGEHDGAAFYTVGQRHGFTVAGAAAREPHYVIAVDTTQNTLTVSPNRAEGERTRATIIDTHWLGPKPESNRVYQVQARYHEAPAPARIECAGEKASVEFTTPHMVTPGQSLVVYESDIVLGGGTIGA